MTQSARKRAVVTGATRGLGRALAEALLHSGYDVVICGREQAAVDSALSELQAAAPGATALGMPCDVGDPAQVQALWDLAAEGGSVELWISNAAINLPVGPIWEADPRALAELIRTNLTGVVLGARVALHGMLAQGRGKLYNVDGFGAAGEHLKGVIPYAATKRAGRYLTRTLAAETKGTNIVVASFDPGIVWTDLQRALRGQSPTLVRLGPVISALAREPHEVAPVLARKLLANTRSGVVVRPAGVFALLFRLLRAPFRPRRERA